MQDTTSTDCPWCRVPLVVPRGGWAYRRSQIVLHLVACIRKPKHVPSPLVNKTADTLIELCMSMVKMRD